MKQNEFFSKKSYENLKKYEEILKKWQKSINLVSKNTISDIWNRHIMDSAALYPFLPGQASHVMDMGSGAGFPGLVLAILDNDPDNYLFKSHMAQGAHPTADDSAAGVVPADGRITDAGCVSAAQVRSDGDVVSAARVTSATKVPAAEHAATMGSISAGGVTSADKSIFATETAPGTAMFSNGQGNGFGVSQTLPGASGLVRTGSDSGELGAKTKAGYPTDNQAAFHALTNKTGYADRPEKSDFPGTPGSETTQKVKNPLTGETTTLSPIHFHLVESDTRKGVFMKEVIRQLGLKNVTVHTRRIEDMAPVPMDVITARALKSLPELLTYARPFVHPDTLCLFLKGATAHSETTAVDPAFVTFDLQSVPSSTHDTGCILALSHLRYGAI